MSKIISTDTPDRVKFKGKKVKHVSSIPRMKYPSYYIPVDRERRRRKHRNRNRRFGI